MAIIIIRMTGDEVDIKKSTVDGNTVDVNSGDYLYILSA